MFLTDLCSNFLTQYEIKTTEQVPDLLNNSEVDIFGEDSIDEPAIQTRSNEVTTVQLQANILPNSIQKQHNKRTRKLLPNGHDEVGCITEFPELLKVLDEFYERQHLPQLTIESQHFLHVVKRKQKNG
jgi:hypothetical protein